MTARERILRDVLAVRASVDRESFEVRLTPEGENYKVELLMREGLDVQSVNRLTDALYSPKTREPGPRPLLLFLFCLASFVFEALVMRTWLCLFSLALAWVFMPEKCDDCGRYHR